MVYLCQSASRIIQPLVNVTGTSNSSGLIEVSTAGPHGLLPNDLVEVLGTLGTVEANGQHTVQNVPDSTHLVIDVPYSRAYVSGGVISHLGWIPGTIATPVPGFSIVTQLEALSAGSNIRVIYEDATDAAFVTAQTLAALQAGPGGGAADGRFKTFTITPGIIPDLRTGFLRMKVLLLQGPWASAQLSAWTS